MENKFYTDDFEHFLKESADNFRMYPSKRVWNSLYNNLHPGRKWPSLVVCLLLLSSVIYIGFANKNEITGLAANTKSSVLQIASATKQSNKSTNLISSEEQVGKNNSSASQTNSNAEPESFSEVSVAQKSNLAVNTKKSKTAEAIAYKELSVSDANNNIPEKRVRRTNQVNNHRSALQIRPASAENGSVGTINELAGTDVNKEQVVSGRIVENEIAIEESDKIDEIAKLTSASPTLLVDIAKAIDKKNEKEWVEDFAFHNKPTTSRRNRLFSQFYVTPSVGFRTLAKNVENNVVSRNASFVTNTAATTAGINHSVTQSASLNVEAGYSLNYTYSKITRLKVGLQLNYTNYKVHAYDMGHFTSTTLLLNDVYGNNGTELVSRSTTLANLPGDASNKKLDNNTFQVSVPLGADFKVAGKNNIQWYVGATLQPTYVLFGNSYLISSDLKNYIYDASFIRKWNVNTGIETFVSYKTKGGIVINAGPQLRYQLLSTYNKSYSYTEKLYNLGIKMGVTKNF